MEDQRIKKSIFKDKQFVKSLLVGIILLILSAIASSLAFSYADTRQGSSLPDLILDNIPTVHLVLLTVLLPAIAVLLALFFLIKNPKKLPFATKAFALLYLIRAFFITLTNIKSRPEKLILSEVYGLSNIFPYKGNDLFFSGHVSFPIMAALIFWNKKPLRNTFIILSILSAIVMLLAKAHYSIDIFAAPFITYSIFKLTQKLFPKDSQE